MHMPPLQGLGFFGPEAAINIMKKYAETPKQYAETPKQKHPKQKHPLNPPLSGGTLR